jgi:hypothetical protein
MSPLRDIDQADDKQRQPGNERIGEAFRNLEHHYILKTGFVETATTRPLNTGLPTWSPHLFVNVPHAKIAKRERQTFAHILRFIDGAPENFRKFRTLKFQGGIRSELRQIFGSQTANLLSNAQLRPAFGFEQSRAAPPDKRNR